MDFCDVGECTTVLPARERRFNAGECKIRYERERGDVETFGLDHSFTFCTDVRKVKLYLDEWCELNGETLEANPVLAYTLDNNIPFYFVDVPLLDKSIVEFRTDGYKIIDLEDQAELTRDIPTEDIPFRRDDVARNKFAADAINYLFVKGRDCVAHVGGTRHFNMQYCWTERWDPYPEDVGTHIHDFLKADQVFIADSETGIIHQLKRSGDKQALPISK